MIIKLLAIIVFVMITSLSVAGCTTSPTPNVNQTISPPNTTTALQSADLSAKFDNALRSYNLTIVVPFTRAVNQYGNWVYTAAAKDGEEKLVPFVHNLTIEETQNRNDTYTRFNAYVAQAVSNGYKPSTSSSSSSYWQGSKGSDSLYINIYEPDQGIYGHVMSVPVTGTNYTIYIEQSTPA